MVIWTKSIRMIVTFGGFRVPSYVSRTATFVASVLACVVGLGLIVTAWAAPPEIVSRAAWKAKPADVTLMKQQMPRGIVIHHTSVRQQPNVPLERKMQGLQSFSLKPGRVGIVSKPAWGDVPYHFYIDALGRIAEGRDIKYAGDSNTKYDVQDRIQVVVEGHFEQEEPNPKQLAALQKLLSWLSATHRIPADKITGHGDHASTDCPGKNLKRHLPTLRKGIAPG